MPFEKKVLDHGFVKLLNLAGPTRRATNIAEVGLGDDFKICNFDARDIDPAQAARMSFDQFDTTRTYEQGMKLNEYLLANRHTSPFEMIQVWLEIKVPIFVDRQFVRHRTFRRNESSGRYVTLPAEWYIPEVVGGKAVNKKQGQEDNLPITEQEDFKNALRTHSHAQLEARVYAWAIVDLLRPHLPGLMDLFDKHCRRPE